MLQDLCRTTWCAFTPVRCSVIWRPWERYSTRQLFYVCLWLPLSPLLLECSAAEKSNTDLTTNTIVSLLLWCVHVFFLIETHWLQLRFLRICISDRDLGFFSVLLFKLNTDALDLLNRFSPTIAFRKIEFVWANTADFLNLPICFSCLGNFLKNNFQEFNVCSFVCFCCLLSLFWS